MGQHLAVGLYSRLFPLVAPLPLRDQGVRRCTLPEVPVTSRVSVYLATRWRTLGVFAVGSLWLGWLSFGVAPPVAVFLKYPVLAERYIEGTLDPERLLDVSFLYFYVHVAARWLTARPELLVQIAQVAALGLAAALLFAIVRRLASPVAGLVASIVLLLDRTVAVYAPILEPEAFLLLAVLAFLLFGMREGRGAAIAAGAALGAALLLRPVLLPMVFLVPLHYWIQSRSEDEGWRVAGRRTVLFLVPVVLAFGLLWGRNAALPIPFSATVMNPGPVFYEGNHPWATGVAATYPPLFAELREALPDSPDPQHELYRLFARQAVGEELTVTEVNRFWRGKAVGFLRDYPGTALRRATVKLNELFRGYAWHDLSHAYWRDRALAARGVPAISFAVVAATGLIGMVLASRRWDRWILFYGVVACQMAATTLVYVSARQKLVMVPLLAGFSALAVVHLIRRRRGWIVFGAAILLLTGLLWLPNDRAAEDRHLWAHLRQSNEMKGRAYALRSEDRMEEAADAAARAVALTPWRADHLRPAGMDFGAAGFANRALEEFGTAGLAPTFSLSLDEAILAMAAGDWQAAEAALTSIEEGGHRPARGSYQSSQVYFYKAELALLQGDREGAESLLDEVLRKAPGDPAALALQAVLTRDATYRDRLERYFDPIHAHFFLGTAHLEFGDPGRAAESFAFVAERLPESRRARIYLAAALGAAGRVDEGVDLYRETTSAQPDPVLLEGKIVSLFQRWVEERPDDPERSAALAGILHSFGLREGES